MEEYGKIKRGQVLVGNSVLKNVEATFTKIFKLWTSYTESRSHSKTLYSMNLKLHRIEVFPKFGL